jgi:multiple sugar transport system substrate-binding protein
VISRYTWAAGAACAVATMLTVTACAGGGSTGSSSSSASPVATTISKPVTITFDEVEAAGSLKTAMTSIVKSFQAANPKITVSLTPYATYGPLLTAEKAQVAAHKAPTLGQAYESWAQTFAQSGSILPISSVAGSVKPAELSTFYTGVQKDLYLPDGKLWMWPFSKSLQLMFYNGSMLKADHISTPTTWTQYAAALKTASKQGVVGTTIDPGSAAAPTSGEEWLEELAAANGTPVYKADGTPQFTSPAAESALNYLVSLKKSGALATGSNYPGETALGAKKGLVDISSSAGYYYESQAVGKKFPLVTTVMPGGNSGAPDMMAGGNLVVFSAATSEQKAAAWKFMQYLASPAVQARWAAATGYYPITSRALTQPAMSSYLAQNPWVKTTIGGLNGAIIDPPQTWVTACGGYLSTALSAALSGTSASSALSTAQNACTSAKNSA